MALAGNTFTRLGINPRYNPGTPSVKKIVWSIWPTLQKRHFFTILFEAWVPDKFEKK